MDLFSYFYVFVQLFHLNNKKEIGRSYDMTVEAAIPSVLLFSFPRKLGLGDEILFYRTDCQNIFT